jgi:adenylate kinase
MERRMEIIRREKSELDKEDYSKIPTRQFLLLNIMPVLTKGMLEVCKINPIDPIDYLANYLFKNSTD